MAAQCTPAIRRLDPKPTSNVRSNRCRLNHASVANNAMACSSNAFPCFPLSFAGYLVACCSFPRDLGISVERIVTQGSCLG